MCLWLITCSTCLPVVHLIRPLWCPNKQMAWVFCMMPCRCLLQAKKPNVSELLKIWTLAVLIGSVLESRDSTGTRIVCMPRIYDDTISSCFNILPHLPALCYHKMYPSPFQFPYGLLIAGVLRQYCVPSAGVLKKECFLIPTIFFLACRKEDSFKALASRLHVVNYFSFEVNDIGLVCKKKKKIYARCFVGQNRQCALC